MVSVIFYFSGVTHPRFNRSLCALSFLSASDCHLRATGRLFRRNHALFYFSHAFALGFLFVLFLIPYFPSISLCWYERSRWNNELCRSGQEVAPDVGPLVTHSFRFRGLGCGAVVGWDCDGVI